MAASLPMPGRGRCTKKQDSTRTPGCTALIIRGLYKSVLSSAEETSKHLQHPQLPTPSFWECLWKPDIQDFTHLLTGESVRGWWSCVCSREDSPQNGTVMGLSVQNSLNLGFTSIVLRKHTIWWLNFKMTLCLLLWWIDWAWGIAAGDLENNAQEASSSQFIGCTEGTAGGYSSLIHFGNLKSLQILQKTSTTGLEEWA